ncbi:MAG: arylsulfatase, partial [Planctomycetota bacterium]
MDPKALSALCLLSAAACSGGEESVPAEHPNLVLIVADDLGWGDVGYHSSGVPTPNIDRLARDGLALDRFYAYPVCSPSRAALMTGRTPMSLDFVRGPAMPWKPRELSLEERTMGEVFRDAGYGTALVGKWHLGLTRRDRWPDRRGFGHFYGFPVGAVDYFTHKRSGGLDWQRDGLSVEEPGYTTDLIAGQAVRYIEERDKGRPFFLFVSFNAPHTPLGAPAELIRKHSGESDPARRKYLAAVDALDQAIGRIRTALAKEGMGENTLLVFLSDNGASPHKGGSNLPLRGGKFDTFEGAIRVPAVLYWPGHLTGGKVSEQVVTLPDLLPTLAAACGFTPLGT